MDMKKLYPLAAAAATGLVTSSLFSLMIDWETIGGVVLVVTPHLLVSVVLAFLVEAIYGNKKAKYLAFVAPLIFPLAATAWTMWSEATKRVSDGSEDMAQFVLSVCVVAILTGCICLMVLDHNSATPAGNRKKT